MIQAFQKFNKSSSFIQNNLLDLSKIHSDKRFKNTAKHIKSLIIAEEEFLISEGWTVSSISGIKSKWTHYDFDCTYSRNHALTIQKAKLF